MLPGGIALVSILLIAGPPSTLTIADLFTAYSMAWRTASFFIAPPELGDRRLRMTYGLRLLLGQIRSRLSWLACSAATDCAGMLRSARNRSWLLACRSVSTVWSELVPIVTTILLTYWCRTGSVDCFQAGFGVSTIVLFGT